LDAKGGGFRAVVLATTDSGTCSVGQIHTKARKAMTDEEPGVGQIWTARADRGPDLYVLVIEVHQGHVQALLCGDECDFATDTDAVLGPRATGCPRRLLVHGDLAATILDERLLQLMGRVTPELVQRIVLRGRGMDFHSTDLGRGRPVVDDTDPRWAWKLEKLRQLRRVRASAAELGWQMHKLGHPEDLADPAAGRTA
jgi:hypothetical protein